MHLRHAAAALLAALLAALPCSARAEGVFVPAPGRVDHLYDTNRGLLYISSGGSVLRYDFGSGTFLTPLDIGTTLSGMDVSPDGDRLAVADRAMPRIHIVDLDSLDVEHVDFAPTFYEGGIWTVAYGADGNILTTSTFLGSGPVALRRYTVATGTATILDTIEQTTMLAASADGSVIGFAEGNISDGRFGRYRVSDGNIIRKMWYEDGTGWYNYEIGVSRNGGQYAIPTYGGTFLTNSTLVKYSLTIGVHAEGRPIGVAYDPIRDLVYFPWAGTTQVKIFNTGSRREVGSYEFENAFGNTGAFQSGRAKVSRDGTLLFVSVDGGIRYVTLDSRHEPSGNTDTGSAGSSGGSMDPMALLLLILWSVPRWRRRMSHCAGVPPPR